MEVRKWTGQWIRADFLHTKKKKLLDATKLMKVIYLNSYHKLYRQLDIPRIEDSLTEIKNKQTNKQKQFLAPLKEVSHRKFMTSDWFYLCVS